MKFARTISVSKTGRPRFSYQLSQASLWQVMESRIQCTCVAPEHSLPLWQSHPHVEEVALVILLRCWTSTTTPSDSLLPPEVPRLTPSGDNSPYFTRHKLEPPPPSPPASRCALQTQQKNHRPHPELLNHRLQFLKGPQRLSHSHTWGLLV